MTMAAAHEGSRGRIVAGNWKMNGRGKTSASLAGELARRAANSAGLRCDIVVCPTALHVGTVLAAIGDSPIAVGAQDCHPGADGAHTGDISASMLADIGCRYVIVGHSE